MGPDHFEINGFDFAMLSTFKPMFASSTTLIYFKLFMRY